MLPYVDNATFSQWPTGLDLSQIVPAGTTAQQSAALTRLLTDSSSWVDSICQQRVAATTDSEQKRVTPNRYGQLEIYPKNFPIISLLSASYIDLSALGSSTWTAIDVTDVMPLARSFVVYDQCYTAWRSWGAQPLVVQYQYENGYPHTTLAASASADATSIQVASTVGVTTSAAGPAGWNQVAELEILDGASSETVTVTAISGTTLTLAGPLSYAHAAGTLVSAVPGFVREAAVLVATWAVKNPRGDGSYEMPAGGGTRKVNTGGGPDGDLVDQAKDLLNPLIRRL